MSKNSILKMLKTFLKNRKEGAAAQSLEAYTKELEKADAEIEAGDFILHEDVVKYLTKKQAMQLVIKRNKAAVNQLIKAVAYIAEDSILSVVVLRHPALRHLEKETKNNLKNISYGTYQSAY
jgi:hypothetical protein